MKHYCWLLIFFIPIALSAQNESSPADKEDLYALSLEELMQIKISVASTKNTDIFNTPSTVSVIDRQMLDIYNFSDLSDALRVISGIHIGRTTSRQQIPTSRWILQDHYPNKVLVMINGIPQWNSVTGETGALNRVSINDVERIEVLKGPASVLYGSNAYSGAINFVLRNTSDNTVGSVRGTTGTAGYFSAGAAYNYSNDKTDYFISFNGQREKGDRRQITDETGVTGYYDDFINFSNLTASVKFKDHNITLNGYNQSEQKLGVDPSFSAALGKPQDLYGYLLCYNNNLSLSEKIKWISQVNYDWQKRIFPRTQDLAQFTKLAGSRTSVTSKVYYDVSESFNAEAGVGYDYRASSYYTNLDVLKDSIITENNLKGKHINEFSAFGQVQYTKGKFNVLIGDRFTVNDYFGNNNSARGTLLVALNSKNSLKLIFGQSFRAPSMFETFYVNPKKSLGGNTELKPETSTSYEIAYLTSFNKFIIQTLVYYGVYDNKIFRITRPNATLPDGSTGTATAKQYVNGNDFTATGVELEAKYQSENLHLFANYNYVVGTKEDTVGTNNPFHYNFKYVPGHTMNAGAALLFNNWTVSAAANYASETNGGLVTDGQSEEVSSWFSIDANISFSQTLGGVKIRHVISGKNLLDNVYEQPEFVDRALTSIPTGINRRLNYTLIISF